MGTLFSRIFGSKKVKEKDSADAVVDEMMSGIIAKASLDLSYEIEKEEGKEGSIDIRVNIFGEDEGLLIKRDGQLLDAFQLLIRRVLQHKMPDLRVNLMIDCGGFRDDSNQALIVLVDKLKGIVLEKGKSVYCRALPPKDRKVIHQYVAKDDRIRSRSIGEGLYKKIKIYPIRSGESEETL